MGTAYHETAKFAHVFLPGRSFLDKDGTFINAERWINRVRPVMAPKTGKHEWQIVCEIARAMGYEMSYGHPREIMDEVAALTPTFAGVSVEKLDKLGSVQWPCNDSAPVGTPTMHVDGFARSKGKFMETVFIPTNERSTRKFPLILTTGRILSQYNVGAQTRRTGNVEWHADKFWDPRMRAQLVNQVEEAGIHCDSRVAAAARLIAKPLGSAVNQGLAEG